MDREEYEKDLRERQRRHLENVRRTTNWQPCLHDGCSSCHGTGVTSVGQPCIHMISCPCPKCSPYSMFVETALRAEELLDYEKAGAEENWQDWEKYFTHLKTSVEKIHEHITPNIGTSWRSRC